MITTTIDFGPFYFTKKKKIFFLVDNETSEFIDFRLDCCCVFRFRTINSILLQSTINIKLHLIILSIEFVVLNVSSVQLDTCFASMNNEKHMVNVTV